MAAGRMYMYMICLVKVVWK